MTRSLRCHTRQRRETIGSFRSSAHHLQGTKHKSDRFLGLVPSLNARNQTTVSAQPCEEPFPFQGTDAFRRFEALKLSRIGTRPHPPSQREVGEVGGEERNAQRLVFDPKPETRKESKMTFSRIFTRRRTAPNQPQRKSHLVRFQDPAGPYIEAAMAAGDALAFGGVRVDITHDGRIDVTPWTEIEPPAPVLHDQPL